MDTTKRRDFRISGMDCAEEVVVLKREIGPIVGGEERLAFHVLDGRMTVLPEAADIPTERIVETVKRTGMAATLIQAGTAAQTPDGRGLKTILTTASGVAILLGMAIQGFTLGWKGLFGSEASIPVACKVLYLIAVLAGVWQVLPKAWFSLKSLRPDMNLLMVVAVTGALAIGDWLEAATVAFLFAVSLALESWSVGRARRAVAALMELAPTIVRVKDAAGERQLPPEQVEIGALFIVRPGDKIPLDGTVKSGQSSVNQASITGESQPVTKEPGDAVYAGTVNGDGLLEVENTKRAQDTTLAKIVQMVSDAQGKRGPSEQWVDGFARVYTPIVMLFAVAVCLLPPLLFGETFTPWLYRSLVLLVIACPCALVISTPVSIVAGLAAAAKKGVLVKGGAFLEAPATLRCIAFDKTGTLTKGEPEVDEVVGLGTLGEGEIIALAASLEEQSSHPIAKAIIGEAKSRGLTWQAASDLQTVQGRGLTAIVSGREFWIGSHRWLDEKKLEPTGLHERLQKSTEEGKTIVVLGCGNDLIGAILLTDAIRAETKATLLELKNLGLERLVMLTGDNKGTAMALASQIGIDGFDADMLPQDKVARIEALVAEFGRVAMVGDGVNDAPALGRATIGIAMGAAGSDAAIETADVALMSDDLSRMPWLVRHSRRTLTVIRQNIAFALAVKAIFMIATFAGFASMWAAIAADAGASLLVIANGLRLLRSEN